MYTKKSVLTFVPFLLFSFRGPATCLLKTTPASLETQVREVSIENTMGVGMRGGAWSFKQYRCLNILCEAILESQ